MTIRGYSACRLLIADEAVFVEDDVMVAVRPMVSVSKGRILAMSTPFGCRGWFHEASKSREWRVTTVTADQCPRISKAFLDQEREPLGDWRFRQEYLCEFTDLAGRMFSTDDIEAAFELGRLGAVPAGALCSGPSAPAHMQVIDSPALVPALGPAGCPSADADDGHHLWPGGRCLLCQAEEQVPGAVA